MDRVYISKYTKSHQCLSKQNTIKQRNNKIFNIFLHTDILVHYFSSYCYTIDTWVIVVC